MPQEQVPLSQRHLLDHCNCCKDAAWSLTRKCHLPGFLRLLALKCGRTSPSLVGIPGRESKIILIPLQLAAFALTTFYMFYRWSELRRRNQRTWEEIVSRLSPASAGLRTDEPGETADLWTVFRDAGVMMELADYAQRHGRDFDAGTIQVLRFTALWLRFSVMRALAGRIFCIDSGD